MKKRQYIQVFIIPVAFTLAGFCGIAVTSAGINLYGEILWDPLRYILLFVSHKDRSINILFY